MEEKKKNHSVYMGENERRGRPRKKIDNKEFEKLCAMQCTLKEIAGWFKSKPETIKAWCELTYKKQFSEVYEIYSAEGKISLRRNQFRMSKNNPTMAIWLGKQYLGQTDKNDIDLKADIPSDGLFAALQKGLMGVQEKKDND